MNQNIKNPLWIKFGIGTAVLLAVAAVWLFLSGALLLQLIHRNPEEAQLLTYYQYWYHYGAVAAIKKKLFMAGGGTFIAMGFLAFLFLKPTKEKLHGEARFANKAEMKKAGLYGERGVIVGQQDSDLLIYGGDAHVVIDA
ncbi:MAG: hypothetical protein RSF79_26875, partial [Janthinobacterium sp.]